MEYVLACGEEHASTNYKPIGSLYITLDTDGLFIKRNK
jgi:hypothetical protein